MIRRNLSVSLTLIFALSSGVCLAQEKSAKPDRKNRDRHAPKLREMGIRDTDGFLEQMKEELKLTDSQQNQIKRYVDEFKRESEDLKKSIARSPDSGKAYADMREQMQQARQSGDKAKQQQLLDELKAKHQEEEAAEAPVREKLEAVQKTLHDRITSSLGEKQRTDFELVWEDATSGRRRSGGLENPRILRAAVMRLPDLTSDQKQKLDELFKAGEKDARDTRSGGQRRRAGQKLHDDIMNVLTKEQKDKVTQELAKRAASERKGAKKPPPPKGG